ncbi:MAG: Galactose-1-phosphate uridylyltransferase [Acidimicrobiales bacterium]|nr:MAG: DUF4931 domain-containing protein [Actinomycetota bacterium]MBV6508942.1 Galactose-1-phosphate uridylyltransferase [Acidimicrobiales bacterium]RIK08421.1 MAG: galactose-1-phosphate uridylyltransferase [Acidobacteriota bacterium]
MEERTDELSGRPVWVTGSRQGRPNLPEEGCPFCPGGLEAPTDYDVRWFPNRWPAMPDDRCEVVLYTPRHDASFASLGIEGATRVIDLWAERTADLGQRDDIAYVLIFENRGPEVGATISHPHGQIYSFDKIPPAPLYELQHGTPPVPEDDELIVSEMGGWSSWVPRAAWWPYELLLAPMAPVADLLSPSLDRPGMAAVLVDALGRLDRLFDAPMPYMLWVHQRPTDGRPWRHAHLHVHIAPYFRMPHTPRFVAAGELGSGEYFNPVLPEAAAEELRAL